MPKKDIDYSKCVIYKIQHKDNNDLLYVGHTTDFVKRKNCHKHNCNNLNVKDKYNLKLYQMIRENGGRLDFNIIQLFTFPCNSKREAEAKEDEIIRELKSKLNSSRPFVQKCEQVNHKREYDIIYRQNNLEKINNNRSSPVLCECGKTVSKRNIAIHRKSQFHLNFICIDTDPPSSSQPEFVSS